VIPVPHLDPPTTRDKALFYGCLIPAGALIWLYETTTRAIRRLLWTLT
jgi:hypothetical protein